MPLRFFPPILGKFPLDTDNPGTANRATHEIVTSGDRRSEPKETAAEELH